MVVVEAMKMEHTLRAEHDGVVREVSVRAGDTVALQQVLVVLDATEPEHDTANKHDTNTKNDTNTNTKNDTTKEAR
jgi:pyruvate/2-oxoglutarate dehydrogenase complex dihydrolipoamide acyltransferase (E2) component